VALLAPPTLTNYVLLGHYDMRPVVWSSTSTSLRLTFFVTIMASSTTSLRILISSLATRRFYTISLVSGIITSSRRSLLLRRHLPRPASDQRGPPRGGNLPALVDGKEHEVVTPQRASRITHHRLAAFISKWGME
jgi:hypothetical protein